ncbi:MAG TPA: hypothetical protein VNB49_13665 [Candidatus Dormibacteraeota bacterium]|nr:hypothetical protein [Candidatus Dormibacteraeota bacterium]
MRKMKIIGLLIIVLLATQRAWAQDLPVLAQIESSVAKQEPKWKLVRKTRTRNGQYFGYDWKAKKSLVAVLVVFYRSSEDAANHFKGFPGLFEENGLKMTVLPTTIPNLGDENYTWKDCCDKRFTGVDFRKGKVVVHVNAPSIEIAQRFASHIAEVLAANHSVTEKRPNSHSARFVIAFPVHTG